jgi:RNA polymerase sigma-70 factor (ECF subfamily)
MATSHAVHGAVPSPPKPPSQPRELEYRLERHRVELTAYSYRMLGSAFEAEDAVQETLVRAWRGFDRFEERAALRSWLYRIATNVCLDMLKGRERRARPMELGALQAADAPLGGPRPEATWIQPIPDSRVLPADGDPAEAAVLRETINLAFVATLQHLPPRQRAVLILREVLQWKATEVAALLETTVASVNSALQRARATLADRRTTLTDGPVDGAIPTSSPPADAAQPMDDAHQALLARYVDAFERYDVQALVSLLHEDATLSMPPYDLWLQGPVEISRWMLGTGAGCRGSRLIPTSANGLPTFGQYRSSGPGAGHQPWSLQVIEVSAGRVSGINAFLDTASLFPLFGLPARLDPQGLPSAT